MKDTIYAPIYAVNRLRRALNMYKLKMRSGPHF